MIFFAVSIVVQILCIMHVINTGRDRIWIWIIILLSGIGCCAYFAFQIMPELFGPGSAHARKSYAKKVQNPGYQLKAAEERLRLVDTAANRTDLADAYFGLRAYGEAATQYRKALDHLNGKDARIETKLAAALFEGGEFRQALNQIDKIATPAVVGEADRLKLLRARILAELDRAPEALDIYADIVTRLPGGEARCRYAALLLDQGDRRKAREVLEAAEPHLLHPTAGEASDASAMAEWAKAQLKTLRTVTE